MEVVILLAIALVVAALGIRVGMLLAPRVERMADRAGSGDRPSGLPPEPVPEVSAERLDEDDDDRTD